MVYPTNQDPPWWNVTYQWNTKYSINPPGGSSWPRNIIGPNNQGPILSSARRYLDDGFFDWGENRGHEYFRARAYNPNGVGVQHTAIKDAYIKTYGRGDISVSKFNFTTGNLS
jgi:hypothetical protein